LNLRIFSLSPEFQVFYLFNRNKTFRLEVQNLKTNSLIRPETDGKLNTVMDSIAVFF